MSGLNVLVQGSFPCGRRAGELPTVVSTLVFIVTSCCLTGVCLAPLAACLPVGAFQNNGSKSSEDRADCQYGSDTVRKFVRCLRFEVRFL